MCVCVRGSSAGKSVTLAGVATVLALLGFEVDCVCYSTYLSERDHKDFAALFTAFGVHKQVRYGTFNKLAENMLNAQGNIRQLTCNFMTGARSATSLVQEGNIERVLLIDEVDVFFKSDFYGNMYAPLATLKSEAFEAVAKHTWGLHAAGRCTFAQLQRFPAYAELLHLYGARSNIIVECIKQMVVDLQGVDEHEQKYLVKDGRIVCVKCSSAASAVAAPSVCFLHDDGDDDDTTTMMAVLLSLLLMTVMLMTTTTTTGILMRGM